MKRFCTSCGKENADGVAFCTECGAKAPEITAPKATEAVSQTAAPKVEATPVQTSPPVKNRTQVSAQQAYNQPISTPIVTQSVPVADATNKVVSTGAYFGLMFLFAIPVIGFIACIIMAFAPKNRNIKNFARAILIWTIIGIVLAGILALVITMMMGSITNYINEMTGGQFSGYGDLTAVFGQLGELSERYESIPIQ